MSGKMSKDRHIALLIELPSLYTADIDDLREFQGPDESESDFLLNCMGEPGPTVRLRVEISGGKGSTVMEVWGLVREAQLVEPSPSSTDAGMARLANWKLLRDGGCEWCDSDMNLPEGADEDGAA